MITEKFLQNTGAVRDLCHDICFELDELSNNEILKESERKDIKDIYNKTKKILDEINELGYFNKSYKVSSKNEIVKNIEEILNIEKTANKYVNKIWTSQITKIEDFSQNNFKFCVKRLPYDLKNLQKNIEEIFKDKKDFYETNLISNQNITVNLNSVSEEDMSLPFGVIFDVVEDSFIMASDSSTFCSLKQKDFETDNMQEEFFGDLKVCIKGSAVRIKTPQQIIEKN